MRIWGRIDRATAREIRGPMLLGVAGFSLVMLLNFLFVLARRTIEKRVPLDLMLGFVLGELPRILLFTIPMGVLLGILVGIGRLATQSELIALRASTVSPVRIFRPVLVVAFVATGIGLVCSQWLMPIGWAHERALMRQVIRVQDLNREIDPGVFFDRLPGAVLYSRAVAESAQGRVFRGILLYRETDDGKTTDLILARRGRGDFDFDTGRRALLLDEGQWHTLEPADPGLYRIVGFEQFTLPFAPDASFEAFAQASADDPATMTGLRLLQHYRDLRGRRAAATEPGQQLTLDAQVRRAGLELHRRLALPAACLGLAIAAFPLAARSRRGGRFAGLSQALLIILGFYVALSTGWALSEQGKWAVWLGPWLPVALTTAWGLGLWARLRSAERGAARTFGRVLLDLRDQLVDRLRTTRAPVPAAEPTNGGRRQRRWVAGRLDVFLGAGFLRMFLAVLFVLLVIVLALAFRNAIEAVDPQARSFPWGDVLRFVGFRMATQLRFMVPIAAIFGAAISLSMLSRTGEVIALKAAGIGPSRMAATMMTAAALVGGVYALAQETVLPAAQREAERTLDRLRGKAEGPELLESGRRWLIGEDGRVWNYIDYDARRQLLVAPGVTRIDFENARLLERIEAAQVRRRGDSWEFSNGWRRTFGPEGRPTYERFTTYTADFSESPELFGEARSRLLVGDALADQLTFARLWANLRQSARTGYPAAPLLVGLNEKFVFPLLPVALVLVAVPLTVSGWHRRGGLQGFAVAILIVFLFWVAHAIATSIGREAIADPVVMTWLPIGIVFAVGIGLLRRAR